MITFDRVTVRYADQPVLRDVSLTIPEGDLCLVVGRTGVGKSTLLGAVNGLVPHFTGGTLAGRVLVDGRDTRTHRPRDLADVVGMVTQDPVRSFVTDNVEEEIAFGMEQLGIEPRAMRKRVEETLDLMGIADLRRRTLTDLSGGQQQRVAIAAVLAAQPRILVLDEPTSALDPTAAQDVLSALTTLVHEVGMTVLLAEHRLERVMHAADSVLWLPGDGSAEVGPAAEVLARADVHPPLADLAVTLGWPTVPLSVREARRRVAREAITLGPPAPLPQPNGATERIRAERVGVRYGKLTAVRDADLRVGDGEIIALMGRNGSGKSSLLWALQGSLPSNGTVTVDGLDPRKLKPGRARTHVALVPQNAGDLLFAPTVAEECRIADSESGAEPGTARSLLARLAIDLPDDQHPGDLSEGQKLALVVAIQLTPDPPVLLLDEPTRGLDYPTKARLSALLAELAAAGRAVVVSTHDVEFAAHVSSRMVLIADGEIIADGPTRELACASPVYAPQIAKVFTPHEVLTCDELPGRVRR
ncbi:ABC transporter ATP-binding protein [Enemella sp. A6]|uniref:ABC transporter ATP-binding protein n=1 Tax=Enemella sp. A6 TaxID=3440152 RepID=UPI003EB77D0A